MSTLRTLVPCPSCNRHVRVGDATCPFCGAAAVTPAIAAGAPGPRARLSRAALFAAGAALLGVGACTDPQCADPKCAHNPVDGAAGAGGATGAGGAAGTTGSAGTSGQAGNDGGMDAVRPTDDGPVAIYSAAFPPPGQTEPGPAFAGAKTKTGRTGPS